MMKLRYAVILLWSFLLGGGVVTPQDISWKSTKGPYGGSVESLVQSAEGRIFAATINGIYGSDDGGMTWNPVALQGTNVHRLARDSAGSLYAATAIGLRQGGTDGLDWTSAGLNGKNVIDIAVGSDNTRFVLTHDSTSERGELYRALSVNDTWEKLVPAVPELPALEESPFVFLHAAPQGTLFLATDHALLRSADNGETWCLVYRLDRYPGIRQILAVTSIRSGDSILVADLYGIHALSGCDAAVGPLPSRLDKSVHAFAREFDGTLLAATGDNGIHRSTDEGLTWGRYSLVYSRINDILLLPDRTLLAANVHYGVLRYDPDRVVLDPSGEGIAALRLLDRAEGDVATVGTTAGVFRPDDDREGWQSLFTERLRVPVVSYNSNINSQDILIGLPERGGIARSTNDGQTWRVMRIGDNVNPVSICAIGNLILVGTDTTEIRRDRPPFDVIGSESPKLYRTTDNGATWDVVYLQAPVRSMIRTNDGNLLGVAEGVIRSTDAGATWESFNMLPDSTAVRIHKGPGPGILAVLGSGLLMYSSNSGGSWRSVGDELPATPVSVAVNRKHTVFVSLVNGEVYRRLGYEPGWCDDCSWQRVNEDLPTGHWYLFNDYDFLYAGGPYGNIRRTVGITTSVDEKRRTTSREVDLLVENHAVDNGTVSVRYRLMSASPVSLILTDLLGRDVRILHDGPAGAGDYREEIFVGDLPSGVYLLRLVSGEDSLVEPILVQR